MFVFVQVLHALALSQSFEVHTYYYIHDISTPKYNIKHSFSLFHSLFSFVNLIYTYQRTHRGDPREVIINKSRQANLLTSRESKSPL